MTKQVLKELEDFYKQTNASITCDIEADGLDPTKIHCHCSSRRRHYGCVYV